MLTHLDLAWAKLWAPLGLALIGLFLLLTAILRLRRGPWRACLRASSGLVLLLVAAALWLLALNLYSYQRLTGEQEVARLSFHQIRPQVYEVTLETAADGPSHYMIHGDEWQLDARIMKWQGWAFWAGLDTRYRLERLSGRFRKLSQERQAERTLVDLRGLSQGGTPAWFVEAEWADLWQWAQDYPDYLPMVDAVYGSATYLPMVDGISYQVNVTSSGLVARPLPAML